MVTKITRSQKCEKNLKKENGTMFYKGDKENILVESKTIKKEYRLEDLKAKKAGLEASLAKIDGLIAEAEKLELKELKND
jgi:hypothetical protein